MKFLHHNLHIYESTVALSIRTADHIIREEERPLIQLSGFGDEISPDLEIQMDVLVSEGISYIDLRSVKDKNV